MQHEFYKPNINLDTGENVRKVYKVVDFSLKYCSTRKFIKSVLGYPIQLYDMKSRDKRTVPRDFRLQVFFMNQFPVIPWGNKKGRFKFFWKFPEILYSRCTTLVVDIGVKWKKSSIKKVLNTLFGYLWVVELTWG